jgi:hypothetical protein
MFPRKVSPKYVVSESRSLFHTNPLVEVRSLQNDLLTVLTSYRDLYVTRSNIERASSVREAATLHVLNHISK